MLQFPIPAENTRVVFGAPGTGKTTYILDRIQRLIDSGVNVENIAFLSFSKAAVKEVVRRIHQEKTPPWFRTVHSCAFRMLNLRRDQVMTNRELTRFNQVTGYKLSRAMIGYRSTDIPSGHWSNEALFIMSTARAFQMSVLEYYGTANNYTQIRIADVLAFAEDYTRYKKLYELYDFADMIERCESTFPTNVSHLFVDEAQDLTPQQWSFVTRLTTQIEQMTIVGDDDQSVYSFAGATSRPLVSYAQAHPEQVTRLEQSYRLPVNILRLSQEVAQRIDERVPKSIKPNVGEPGNISLFSSFANLDYTQGNWLILSRHSYALREVAQLLQDAGYAFWFRGEWSTQQPEIRVIAAWQKWLEKGEIPSHGDKRVMSQFRPLNWPPPLMYADKPWHEIYPAIPPMWGEYYERLRKNGELNEKRIRLCTIHESKGTEEDNVVLLTDYSKAVQRQVILGGETGDGHQDELRVLYVALTRAKKQLFIQHAYRNDDNYLNTMMNRITI